MCGSGGRRLGKAGGRRLGKAGGRRLGKADGGRIGLRACALCCSPRDVHSPGLDTLYAALSETSGGAVSEAVLYGADIYQLKISSPQLEVSQLQLLLLGWIADNLRRRQQATRSECAKATTDTPNAAMSANAAPARLVSKLTQAGLAGMNGPHLEALLLSGLCSIASKAHATVAPAQAAPQPDCEGGGGGQALRFEAHAALQAFHFCLFALAALERDRAATSALAPLPPVAPSPRSLQDTLAAVLDAPAASPLAQLPGLQENAQTLLSAWCVPEEASLNERNLKRNKSP